MTCPEIAKVLHPPIYSPGILAPPVQKHFLETFRGENFSLCEFSKVDTQKNPFPYLYPLLQILCLDLAEHSEIRNKLPFLSISLQMLIPVDKYWLLVVNIGSSLPFSISILIYGTEGVMGSTV